jgi:hypothetical protein
VLNHHKKVPWDPRAISLFLVSFDPRNKNRNSFREPGRRRSLLPRFAPCPTSVFPELRPPVFSLGTRRFA